MTALTIAAAARALRAGTLTATGLLRQVSDEAEKLDPQLGVYITRFPEQAAAAAERADRDLAAGIDRGPLHGIPLGVKDILATKGWVMQVIGHPLAEATVLAIGDALQRRTTHHLAEPEITTHA